MTTPQELLELQYKLLKKIYRFLDWTESIVIGAFCVSVFVWIKSFFS